MSEDELREAWAKAKPRVDFKFLTDKNPVVWLAVNKCRFLRQEEVNWYSEMEMLYGEGDEE